MTAVPAVAENPKPERPKYPRLYERRQAIEIVEEWLQEFEGELTPEIEELLAQAGEDFDTKVERIAKLIQEKELAFDIALATAQAIEAKAKPYRDRARVEENGINRLKDYLKRELVAAGTEEEPRKVKRPGSVQVRVQWNSAPAVRLVADSQSAISAILDGNAAEAFIEKLAETDPALVNVKVTRTLNTKEVVERWKAKAALPTGIKVELGRHVRIS